MAKRNKYDEISHLLSGYVDGELTQQESQKVRLYASECEKCRQAIEGLQQLKSMVKEADMKVPEHEKIEQIMQDPQAQMLQGLGWFALIIGVSIILAFGMTHFFLSPTVSTVEKVFSSLIWGGLLGIFLSILRQQLIARKTDKYKGVKL